jgi:hypothetical protein
MARFEFYEIVRITTSDKTKELGVAGDEGAILGMAEEPESGIWYTVLVGEQTYSIAEDELQPTGRSVTRDDLYDGSSLRATMRGDIIEESD